MKGNRRKREKERAKVGNNNGQLPIANATSGGACKPPGPKYMKQGPVGLVFSSLAVPCVSLCGKARGSEEGGGRRRKEKESVILVDSLDLVST